MLDSGGFCTETNTNNKKYPLYKIWKKRKLLLLINLKKNKLIYNKEKELYLPKVKIN